MTNVGMRELRNHLSEHVAAAGGGEPVTITDHGRAVARRPRSRKASGNQAADI